jgi:hypothetical protein
MSPLPRLALSDCRIPGIEIPATRFRRFAAWRGDVYCPSFVAMSWTALTIWSSMPGAHLEGIW